MGQRMRAYDWEHTPVGAPAQWPQSLKTALAILLQCRLPMYIAWGPGYTQFYNDPYRAVLGDKHPAALGGDAPTTWREIWPTIEPMWQEAKAGRPIGFDDFMVTIERFGFPEDCFFNFSYSAVPDDDGAPQGVLVTFAETTARVKNERRLALLDELTQATRQLSDPAEVMRLTAEKLGVFLGANRCAYAQVREDQDSFDLVGDYNDGVDRIVGTQRFTDFGAAVHGLMLADQPYVNPDVDTDPAMQGMDLSAYRKTGSRAVICVPLHKQGRLAAAMAVQQSVPRRWSASDVELVRTVADRCWESLERIRTELAFREEAQLLEVLNQTGAALSAELDLQALLQRVTDAATRLTGARFGAFFYNGVDAQGEALLLYTLSGAPREAFAGFGHPRPTAMFGPTFRGEPPIRIDDVKADPRYGQWGPHHGMPPGHLPVRSYLAVPVVSRSGETIGGLFFGHPQPAVFSARSERLAVGVAGQAAIAVDNARLYAQAQETTRQRDLLLESERSARQEAERAGMLKDQFLATLSHELRTPLSAILGWVHILRRKLAPEQQDLRHGVEVIERSTRVQVQLIEDLLDMSRITSGKLSLELEPVAPAGFVAEALEVSRPAAESAGVALEASLEAAGPVLGDSARLQQVVWNLLANGIKFTPRGGRVTLALREDAGWAVVEVADTGIGIAPDVLPNMFERFRQADGSTTRRFGGLGLGLSIVRQLVLLHGGTVDAASAGEGQGARFTVRLPLIGPTQDGAQAAPAEPAEIGEQTFLDGLEVLLVDDEADTRELLQRVLEEAGARVRTAASAEEALAALQQATPQVLVSDIGMPGMDGFELMQRVRRLALPGGARLPAVALTAFARAEDRERALAAGFDEHIAKPVEPPLLLKKLAGIAAGG